MKGDSPPTPNLQEEDEQERVNQNRREKRETAARGVSWQSYRSHNETKKAPPFYNGENSSQ